MEVEKIIGKKGKGKKSQYLVKWKGKTDCTWEPLKHLDGCMDTVRKYEDSKKKKGTGKIAQHSEVNRTVQELIVPELLVQWRNGYQGILRSSMRLRGGSLGL